MNDDCLFKRTKNTFLLSIVLFICSIIFGILFSVNIILYLIKVALAIRLFGYLVSLLLGIIISIYSTYKSFKYYMVNDIKIYYKEEVKIGKNGLLVFIYSIYLYAFSIIQLISQISSFDLIFFIYAIAMVVLASLNTTIGIIILRLSGKYYKEKKDETTI